MAVSFKVEMKTDANFVRADSAADTSDGIVTVSARRRRGGIGGEIHRFATGQFVFTAAFVDTVLTAGRRR